MRSCGVLGVGQANWAVPGIPEGECYDCSNDGASFTSCCRWHGDHLSIGVPTLDSTIALAVAAAATERIHIGTSVYVPALRPLAWAAKQIATLQYVSGGRLLLGVGSGGGPAQWAAAGVPYEERGTRTDTALRLLPALLAGEQVTLPGLPEPTDIELAPPALVPPVPRGVGRWCLGWARRARSAR